MLIYNSKKEFIGIDEEDLNALGFSNLSELMSNVADFADMFVKEPGLVHNFNHVSWIDFIACSDSIEHSKVIIDTKSRTFKSLLDVKIAYLTDDPSSKAFLVTLINLKEISSSAEIKINNKIVEEPDIDLEIPEQVSVVEEVEEEPVNLDIPLDLEFDDNLEKEVASTIEPSKKLEEITTSLEVYDNGYIYDPKIASDELGLPVDLIEEFIEDFITQAKEFKTELYQSFDNGDSENLKIMSHKLKGVAANLRIEDAFEALSIINTSNNDNDIKLNLDTFYNIISKLSGEKTQVTQTKIDELDIFAQNHETEVKQIEDNEVPKKIDILELYDDDFLNQNEEKTIEVDDSINIETISDEEITSLENESVELEDIELIDGIKIDNETIDIIEDSPAGYNKKEVAQEIGIDYENFIELYEDFIYEAKDISNAISNAIENKNSSVWKNKAAQLKAMCENMRINEFTKELEILIDTEDTDIAKNSSVSLTEAIIKISNLEG